MLSVLMANELDYVTILPFIAGAGSPDARFVERAQK